MKRYWYNQFLSIPPSNDCFEYKRLKRLWMDRTRFKGKKGTPQRLHELVNPNHETHLTATLWENFALFDSGNWLNELLKIAGLSLHVGQVEKAKWSYEWGYVEGHIHRLFDVTINYRIKDNIEGVIVIESKNLGKEISQKDTDPSYYLDIPPLQEYGSNRFLIYCVDSNVIEKVNQQVQPSKFMTGVISWQKLGELQMGLVESLHLDSKVMAFMKAAISFQYQQHGVILEEKVFDYLNNEPAMYDIDNDKSFVQTHQERLIPIWKL